MEPLPTLDAEPLASSSKPSQIKFLRPGQMALFARVTTYPPLGQVTVVPPSRKQVCVIVATRESSPLASQTSPTGLSFSSISCKRCWLTADQLNFTVVIESSQSLPEQPWEVSIWYDHGAYAYTKSTWKSLDLQRVPNGPTILYDERDSTAHRYTFESHLPSPFPDNGKTYKGRKVPFTVRFRINADSDWQWVSQNFGLKDGEVILQPPVDLDFLGAGPVELKDGWYARKLASEARGAKLYSIESGATIPTPDNDDAQEESLTLGHVSSTCKWFALIRIWTPWLAPRHGDRHFHLTEPAILLSFLRADGQHVVLLAPNGIDDCLTTFRSDDAGNIVVRARNDTGAHRKFRVLAATAWNFEVANAALMYEMRKQVRQSSAYQQLSASLLDNVKAESVDSDTVLVSQDDNRDPTNDDTPTPQWLVSWYDSLAYCTWNGLGQDLNADKVCHVLQDLADNDIRITNLIIDDNWQSLTGEQGKTTQFNRYWTDFEANPIGFPGGLKANIDKIRAAHPRLRDIAVWHALGGYWGGVSPDTGHLHKDYKLRKVTLDGTAAGGERYLVDPSDIHRMYDDFYAFLGSCGVTGVKTDVQFYLDLLASSTDRRDMTTTYQSAWTRAHLRHLSGKAISCMSQIPQILFHSFLPTNTPRIMLRNSDDFFPDVPTSHPWHVFTNAHSALFVQHLNVLPDWDMFQTSHAYSGFHAASRCISGGPIYITDYPGEHDIDLIHQMTAANPRGDTVILRPSNVAKTIGIYDKYEDGSILKIGVYDGRAETGTGMMGVFNIAEKQVSSIIPISDIPGVKAYEDDDGKAQAEVKRRYIVRSHVARTISAPITPAAPPKGGSLLEVTMPIRGYDIWTALPVHGPFSVGKSSTDLAVVGLLGKMTGACAVLESRADISNTKLKINVQLKALGVLGIWLSDAGSREVGDMMITIRGHPIPPERVEITTEGVSSVGGDGSATKAGLLEIDVEGAWNDLKLDAGWGNEVAMEILLV